MQGFTKNNTEFTIADSANLDAFSRLRVSSPQSLFSVQCQYNNAPITMESGNTGTGVAPAHSANTRMVKLSCTAGTGTSFMQSYQYIPYQPSKSQQIFITGLLDTAVAGAVVDVGYFDADNGIFFRQDGTNGLKFVRRTKTSGSVVNNEVAQSSWNIDKLDGTGKSGITLDVTKVYILCIDLQFLAMGRIRIGFDIGGVLVYAHEFLNANILTVPYMQTATLPVQMLLTATSTGATKDCYFKCAAVNAEGGNVLYDDFAFAFTTPDTSVTAGNNTRTHLISLRPKTTFNSITNRELLLLDQIEIFVSGTNPVFWELCLGQAITSASWADINTSYSGFEYGTGTISGSAAITIASGYIASGATVKEAVNRAISSRYPITLDRAGAVRANGTLSLVVTGLGGTSATRSSIQFREIR
jgi:hypothetical protein